MSVPAIQASSSTGSDTPSTEGKVARRQARRRKELADAAARYAMEHGVSDLSLRALARNLGVTHRALLYHFGTKEQLLAELLRAARDREQRFVEEEAKRLSDKPLDQLLRSYWRRAAAQQPFFRFYFEVYGLALREPDRYQEFLAGAVDDWLVTIRGLMQRRCVPEAQARNLATLMFASFRGLQLDLLSTGSEERVELAFELFIANVKRDFDLAQHASPTRPERR